MLIAGYASFPDDFEAGLPAFEHLMARVVLRAETTPSKKRVERATSDGVSAALAPGAFPELLHPAKPAVDAATPAPEAPAPPPAPPETPAALPLVAAP